MVPHLIKIIFRLTEFFVEAFQLNYYAADSFYRVQLLLIATRLVVFRHSNVISNLHTTRNYSTFRPITMPKYPTGASGVP